MTGITYKAYPDVGCKFFSSCLNCPLEQCLEDYLDDKCAFLKEIKTTEIRQLLESGKSKGEIAILFGVCERTIQRAI